MRPLLSIKRYQCLACSALLVMKLAKSLRAVFLPASGKFAKTDSFSRIDIGHGLAPHKRVDVQGPANRQVRRLHLSYNTPAFLATGGAV